MNLVDDEGFLVDSETWTPQFAIDTAKRLDIELSEDHWDVLSTVRRFYLKTGVSPSMRPLVNLIRDANPSLANSIVLATMFTGKTSRVVAQLAGIPKPSDCL